MGDDDRWRRNWLAVSPPGAVKIELPRSARRRRALITTVSGMPAGTAIVVSASAPRAASRCRTFAADAGIELKRHYLAFPGPTAPAYLVEDAPPSIRLFLQTVLSAPPRSAWSMPISACLGLLRSLNQWRLLRRIAPGRVAVGRRR